MHYTDRNFKTKKALKEAVEARLAFLEAWKAAGSPAATKGNVYPVTVYNPEAGLGQEAPTPANGRVCVGGPHFPEPHKWYSTVTLKDGEVVKVS